MVYREIEKITPFEAFIVSPTKKDANKAYKYKYYHSKKEAEKIADELNKCFNVDIWKPRRVFIFVLE